MQQILAITFYGILAGVVGTGLGGLFTVMLGKPKDSVLSSVLAFSGGIMLAVIFVDLLPEALAFGSIFFVLCGLIIGVIMLALLDMYFPHSHFSHFFNEAGERTSHFIRTSILLCIGIAMHNLPEGLAIGAGYIASENIGIGLALIIGLHNIPEGAAIAGPMKAGQVNSSKILLWTCLAGLPMGVGTLLGAIIGGVSNLVLALALGVAAGAMLYVIFDELLPDAHRLADGHSATIGAVVGVILGLLFLLNM